MSGVTDALCTAVARVMAAAAKHLQVNLIMLEDDSVPVVRQILPMKSRLGSAGDPLGDPVVPPFCRITAEKVYAGDDPFTPVTVYAIGNLGDYQCNTASDLETILESDGHPQLEEVTLATYDIDEEDEQTYEEGYTMGWSFVLYCADGTEVGS